MPRRRPGTLDPLGRHRELLEVVLRDELWSLADETGHDVLVACRQIAVAWLAEHPERAHEAWAAETERARALGVGPRFEHFIEVVKTDLVAHAKQVRPEIAWRDHHRALYETPRWGEAPTHPDGSLGDSSEEPPCGNCIAHEPCGTCIAEGWLDDLDASPF